MWGYRLDLTGSGQGQVAGTCECGNELSGSIKCREFLDQLRTDQFLKKDCTPWSKYGFSAVRLEEHKNRQVIPPSCRLSSVCCHSQNNPIDGTETLMLKAAEFLTLLV